MAGNRCRSTAAAAGTYPHARNRTRYGTGGGFSSALAGHGNKIAADQAAVDAMRRELNKIAIDGTVVIGEGERDKAPMLFIDEKVGNSNGPKVDIAVDPLDGTTHLRQGYAGCDRNHGDGGETPLSSQGEASGKHGTRSQCTGRHRSPEAPHAQT
jgi:hypothetical protein